MAKISVVIAVRPGKEPLEALAALAASDRDGLELEVILAEGLSPSRQRNQAVEAASGEIIYFLDDDATVAPDSIRIGLAYLREYPQVAVVGGPALTRSQAGSFERAVGLAMGIPWTAGATAARHHSIGSTRAVEGHELSLCNLMVRRAVLQRVTGFAEHLYPSEDPEFLKRVRAHGEQMVYLPHMQVQRSRRQTLAALAQQFFRYGQGRATHIGYRFTARDLQFFAPSVLLVTALVALLSRHPLFVSVVAVYLLALLSVGWGMAQARGATLLYFICAGGTMHASYGLGFLVGCVRKMDRSNNGEVKLQIRTLP